LAKLGELHLNEVNVPSPTTNAFANFTSLTLLQLQNPRLQGDFPPEVFLATKMGGSWLNIQ